MRQVTQSSANYGIPVFDTTTRYIRAGQLFKQNAAGMAGL
jgi:hypothetical protein